MKLILKYIFYPDDDDDATWWTRQGKKSWRIRTLGPFICHFATTGSRPLCSQPFKGFINTIYNPFNNYLMSQSRLFRTMMMWAIDMLAWTRNQFNTVPPPPSTNQKTGNGNCSDLYLDSALYTSFVCMPLELSSSQSLPPPPSHSGELYFAPSPLLLWAGQDNLENRQILLLSTQIPKFIRI